MKTFKSYRFRIYPTEAQTKRLLAWESALRFLWNLAHEQRLMGLARTDKRYPSGFDQHKELTELRAILPWLADVPRGACETLLTKLDEAWQRCFGRLGCAPRWKRRALDFPSMHEARSTHWWHEGPSLHFPRLGVVHIVQHRALEGKPKSCTIRRDGDQWFASIMCEVEAPTPAPRTEPVVAIDRGIASVVADSDGSLVANPRHLDRALRRLARAQRVVARRKKGSKNQQKARVRVMRLHRKVRRQREHFLHVLSHHYAKNHGTVIVEKLNVAGMARSRLARHILGAGWSRFVEMLRYKLAWSGGTLVEVPAAYSSQTCSACGAVDAASRNGERFVCTSCGHTDHADLNAAKVLKQRFEAPGNPWCLPAEGTPPEGSRRSRKVRLRTPRTMTSREVPRD
jgi:putative transposase